MVAIRIKVDTRAAVAGLRAASRAADKQAVKGVRKAAKEVALPIARTATAGELPGRTTAGATRKGAYVGQKHPGAAIDEFGGTRRDVIRPVTKRAVMTPYGPRALVSGPRVYPKKLVLTKAAERARPLMERPVKDAVLDAYRPYFDIV